MTGPDSGAFVPPEKTEKKKRGPLGIRHQVLLGFLSFTLVIVVLLWVFQIFLLNPFYQAIKSSEARQAAKTVVQNLDSGKLEEVANRLCADMGINLYVTDELGTLYVSNRYPFRDSLVGDTGRASLIRIFDLVNLSGGTYTETFRSTLPSPTGVKMLFLYAQTARTADGENRLVLVESEITPVDATVQTLTVQLACLTVVMVLLGAGLALFLAHRISRPITSINESAKALASGDYQAVFEGTGSKEVRELAHTLNHTAGELSKVDQLRRELLANVSHDLRTPLTMIKGYSEVMRDLPGENTPENAQIIADEASRLTDLVNDLLDLSRLEAGVVALDKSSFDLTAAIRSMLHRYDKLAGYHFPFYADRNITVFADELKISQVVYNLVNNAVTYIGEDHTVTLRQTEENGMVRISVTDTGEGIPADKLRDIWERYYKVDKEHKRAQVGTGLGLSIVKNILDLHGGAYGVESALGQGSTFWFELPAPQPDTDNTKTDEKKGD